jgi:serine/threonine protein kinase
MSRHTKAVDIWGCGCVLAELIKGSPIFPGQQKKNNFFLKISPVFWLTFVTFIAGSSTKDQILRVLDFTGRPSKADVQSLNSEHAIAILQTMGLAPE